MTVGQAHVAVHDLIEYQTSALQRVYFQYSCMEPRRGPQPKPQRRELMPLTNGVFGAS